MTRALWTLAAALTLALPGVAVAESALHTVSTGDTLESISTHYYGTDAYASSLALHNDLSDPALSAGQQLQVPRGSSHVVARGDRWESLAARYWDDASLGAALATLTQPSGVELEPGTELLIPALIPYEIQRGDTFASFARRAYRGPARADAIARLNWIESPNRIFPGQRIRLPVLGRALPTVAATKTPREEPAPRVSAAPPTPRSESAPTEPAALPAASPPSTAPVAALETFSAELRAATDAYYAGDFASARADLETLRAPVLSRGNDRARSILLRHLVMVYVAYDQQTRVCASHRALRALDGDSGFDAELISPRILEALKKCD